jgi:hypothetical protein
MGVLLSRGDLRGSVGVKCTQNVHWVFFRVFTRGGLRRRWGFSQLCAKCVKSVHWELCGFVFGVDVCGGVCGFSRGLNLCTQMCIWVCARNLRRGFIKMGVTFRDSSCHQFRVLGVFLVGAFHCCAGHFTGCVFGVCGCVFTHVFGWCVGVFEWVDFRGVCTRNVQKLSEVFAGVSVGFRWVNATRGLYTRCTRVKFGLWGVENRVFARRWSETVIFSGFFRVFHERWG